MFQNIKGDLRAHGGNWRARGFWVMVAYRFGRWRYTVRPAVARKPFSLLYKLLFKLIQITTGTELPCEAIVGRNFAMDQSGGIIVSGFVRIGDNCRVRRGAVIGLQRTFDSGAPVIGDNVDIGAGAKVLGPIVIGNNVSIDTNAVVIRDIPNDCTASGIPAVNKPKASTPAAS